MSWNVSPRFPTFEDGKLLYKDLYSKLYQKIVVKSDEGEFTFERVPHSNTYWIHNGKNVGNIAIMNLINFGGFRGLDVAVIDLYIRDPYLVNPRMIQVPRMFKYGVIYHDTKKKLKRQPINPNSPHALSGSLSNKRDCHLEIFPLTDDTPMRTCDIWD